MSSQKDVHHRLKDAIIYGELTAGEKLFEFEVEEIEFKVSSTL